MAIDSAKQEKDSAKVRADVLKCAGEAQTRASAELLFNLHMIVNDPAFSDVVFVCKDGTRVHALRMLLASRSPVFKSMLMNGMKESGLAEIQLPETLSLVLLCVIEFLYTGFALTYHPQTWRMACAVLKASRFFLLPDLEMIVRKFMLNQISIVAEDLTKAASFLTDALSFDALFDKTDALLGELLTILSSDWSDSDFVVNLSLLAFQHLLVNTKGDYDDDDKFSLTEYLRFRQVILWWVSRSDFGSCATDEFMDFIAPDEKLAWSLCRNSGDDAKAESTSQDVTQLSNQWNILKLDEALRNSTIGLFSNIDCRWIHPILLAKVVEPLKVIPAEEMQNSFRFHALQRSLILDPLKCDWALGESYITLEHGYVIDRRGSKTGLAMMWAEMFPSSEVYEWHFVLEEASDSFAELGFMSFKNKEGRQNCKFDGNVVSDLDCARVLKFIGSEARVNWQGDRGRSEWRTLGHNFDMNERASFNYDSSKRTCSLSINGQDFGVVWENLPRRRYYPAIALGNSSKGRVRIELVSEFDIL